MKQNLTIQTIHGIKWSYISSAITAIAQIGFTAVIARLLAPSDFGLIALAGIILRFGGYFSQLGLGSAIIQKESLSENDIRASFTSSTILGLLFFLLAYLAAPLGAALFNVTDVIPVLRAMAFSFFISGISTTSIALLRRQLRFKALAFIEILSNVIGYMAVGLILAFLGFGLWSLVICSLCQLVVQLFLSWRMQRQVYGFNLNWSTHKSLLSFGGRLSIISFLEFIGYNIDTIVIGRTLGPSSLGIYTRSFSLVNLPIQYLAVAIGKVMFPSLSLIQVDRNRVLRAYLRGVMLVNAIALPISLGTIPAAREIVLVLLGQKWTSGIVILQILSLLVPFNMATSLPAIVCDALGELRRKLFLQIIFIGVIGGLIAAVYRQGIASIAIAAVIANATRFILYQFLMRDLLSLGIRDMLQAIIPGLKTGLAAMFSIFALHHILRMTPPLMLLGFELLMGIFALIIFLIMFPTREFRFALLEMIDRFRPTTKTASPYSRAILKYERFLMRSVPKRT